MDLQQLTTLGLLLIAGLALGSLATRLFYRVRVGGLQRLANDIIHQSEVEADKLSKEASLTLKKAEFEHKQQLEQLSQREQRKRQREEERLKKREDKLETRLHLVDKKAVDVEKREITLAKTREQLEQDRETLCEAQKKLSEDLEHVSGMTTDEAKATLLSQVSDKVKADAANLTRRIIDDARENGEREAGRIVATTINRLGLSSASEAIGCTVPLPSEDMKGRIIGREGRNIRTLERLCGINFVMDDTPGAVMISGFDPVRKHIAKTALTELIFDGRIHPTRIEEVVAKAEANTDKQIREFGEDAALRAGAIDLHPEIITLLGKLKLRFSFGQNVLEHALEVSHIMGIMADELHLNVPLARRMGLLHDIGKATSHEVEGPHALIGHNLALKYGESEEAANGIGCHHREMDPFTVEGSLCSAADAISAARPGARIEAIEEYIKRLRRLEDIAFEFPGVDKAYALQAGREIRIVVLPDMVDDDGIINLARDLSHRIEQELAYPGRIKITIIREKRAVEYAV